MQSFISETLDDILKTTKTFENVVFVLPSQRARIFIKHRLKDKISSGFLPEIITIEEFIEEVSEIKKIDTIQLLFHFYTVYKKQEIEADAFDVFSSWAFTVLQDFNEIDQHLIDTKDIFVYLRDIQRLRKWSTQGTFKETELIKDHFSFMEKLGNYYTAFYKFLKGNTIGYQGLLYRESTKKIENYIAKNQQKKIFFIGFNALNKAEEFLFQKMLSAKNTEIYWDIDTAFFENNHQAGNFIRKYKSQWKYYENNTLKIIGNSFSSAKKIELIGVSKNIAQLKYTGEILSKISNHSNTALVLADETLLPIALNSLPKNVDAINITMGYPLKDIPITKMFSSIFQLFLTQEKLQKTASNLFYHKDIIGFIKQPSIYALLSLQNRSISDAVVAIVRKENKVFISQKELASFFSKMNDPVKHTVLSVFDPFKTITEFLTRILNLITLLKETNNELEKEYIFRFYKIFMQLQTLHLEFNYFQDLKTVSHFFRQLIQSESLSFQGEPLQGLQLMGMLETRVLDFENVILTSVNEGILPANSQQNSFIPFDVKVQFGLPTYREKDAIFSYHFFRLLQRAKNVFIIYNTEHDSFGSGEKSRFVHQLELIRKDISEKVISPKVITEKTTLKEIFKTDTVLIQLKELAEKGISPSALTNYLYNPISFYKQKILKIREFENVEETVAVKTLGTVVHEVLDELYTPYVDKFLSTDDINEMQKQSKELVEKQFKIWFKNGDISTGKNRLIFEVANRFVYNFLAQEKIVLKDENNQLKIIATEETLATEIEISGIDFPIKIHGQVDRVDELNGVTRIIDYKTGMVNALNLKLTDFENIRELKYHKAIQVLLYVFLYTKSKNHDFSTPIEAGIFSFKNLKSGFLSMNFSSNYRTPDNLISQEKLNEFILVIKDVLKEIYNPEIPFLEASDLPY
ncbi:MAG: PD-(D/E)XK nuclease family protein [Polaribacter sp.]